MCGPSSSVLLITTFLIKFYILSVFIGLVLQLCLEAKCLKAALPFLDEEIHDLLTEVSQTTVSSIIIATEGYFTSLFLCTQGDQFDVKYLLLYFYYGGMIYTTLKLYDRACFFFTAVSAFEY